MGSRRIGALLGSASLALGLTVLAGPPAAEAATYTLSRTTAINVPESTAGLWASVSAFGLGGLVTDVDVKLSNLSHTYPGDFDIELVGPDGQAVMLMSDQCGGNPGIGPVSLTFDDDVPATLGATNASCPTGSYKPGNGGAGDPMPFPITATTLGAFDGTNPNGIWTVGIVDDADQDAGSIATGFTITITTGAFSVLVPSTSAPGPASSYPLTVPVSGKLGTITDVDVVLGGVTHRSVDDLDILLVAPNGAKALLVSDPCGDVAETGVTWTFDDEAASPLPALNTGSEATCGTGTYWLSNTGSPDDLQAPAPAAPYSDKLSVFDGMSPNGSWQFYVMDDQAGGNGFLIEEPHLVFRLTDVTPPQTNLKGKKPPDSTRRTAKVTFSSSEAGSHFECRLDGGKYKACTSPKKLKHLKVGKHKLFVRAIDAAGNVDTTPLKIKWKVLHT